VRTDRQSDADWLCVWQSEHRLLRLASIWTIINAVLTMHGNLMDCQMNIPCLSL